MKTDEANSSKDFSDIWRRVSGKDTEDTPMAADAFFPPLIEQSACIAAFGSSLAKMLQNPGRGILQRQALHYRTRLKQLRAEYFLMTGESDSPHASCPAVSGKLASLRELHRMYVTSRKSALAAADKAPAQYAEDFRSYAAADELHAQEVRALLVDCF